MTEEKQPTTVRPVCGGHKTENRKFCDECLEYKARMEEMKALRKKLQAFGGFYDRR